MNEFDTPETSEPTETKLQASLTADQARKRTSESLGRDPDITEYVNDINRQIALASSLGLSSIRPSCCCTNDRSALCSPPAVPRAREAIGRHYEQLGFRCLLFGSGSVMELSWPEPPPKSVA